MSFYQFMSEYMSDIREIINQMERPFDTHVFEKKIRKEFSGRVMIYLKSINEIEKRMKKINR